MGRELSRLHAALRTLITQPTPDAAKVAEANEQVRAAEQRQAELNEERAKLESERIDAGQVTSASAAFDPAWEQLSPKRVIRLLVERVSYDGSAGTIDITFRPTGIRSLASEHEVAA